MYRLYKLKFIELNPALEFTSLAYNKECCKEFEEVNIGFHDSLQSCVEALGNHVETDDSVFSYVIEGPETGHGKLDYKWKDEPWPGYDEVPENQDYDASPELILVHDKNKNLVSSYYFDKGNPGGERHPEEHNFYSSERVWVKQTVYNGDTESHLLMPAVIVEKLTAENGKVDFNDPQTSNLEKDQLIFQPLMTVKANWGAAPETPTDVAPRVDFLPKDF